MAADFAEKVEVGDEVECPYCAKPHALFHHVEPLNPNKKSYLLFFRCGKHFENKPIWAAADGVLRPNLVKARRKK